MQNKKLYLFSAIGIVVIAVAAFIGGRLLTAGSSSLGFFTMGGGPVSTFIRLERAPELPTTEPAVNGTFVERRDNTIMIQAFPLDIGGGGVVVVSPADASDAPNVEVVITNGTVIYLDATEIDAPPSAGETVVQQRLEEGTLDDLTAETMVMVWGRKNGDRIIAEVIVYTYPIMFKRP